MPFAGFANFDECVAQAPDKVSDPKAYCASIMREVEGKSDDGLSFADLPDGAKAVWAEGFLEAFLTNDAPTSARAAWAGVHRRFTRNAKGEWAPLTAFGKAIFKSIFKSDRVVFGVASLAMRDKDGDLITEEALKGAFRSYLDRRHVMFYHKNIPVGEVLPSYRAPDGTVYESGVMDGALNVAVRFYKDTKVAEDVWGEIESGRLRAFSIGGEPIGDPIMVHDGGQSYRRIDRLDLHEISVVPEPANPGAYFTIIKSQSRVCEGDACAAHPKTEMKKTMCEEHVAKMAEMEKQLAEIKALLAKEHEGKCPPGEHLVDDECVPLAEKNASPETPVEADPVKVQAETAIMKAEEPKAEAKPPEEPKPEPAVEKPVEKVEPKPEPAPEPKPELPPAGEKRSLVPQEEKGQPATGPAKVDWSRPPWSVSDSLESVRKKLWGK